MKNSCVKIINNKVFVVKDSGRRLTILNRNCEKLECIDFDGCVVSSKSGADFVIRCSRPLDFIIELKGKNVEHAIKQVERTVIYLKQSDEWKGKAHGAIYCRQVPSGSSTINRKREKLFKEHGVDISISSSNKNFCISSKKFC